MHGPSRRRPRRQRRRPRSSQVSKSSAITGPPKIKRVAYSMEDSSRGKKKKKNRRNRKKRQVVLKSTKAIKNTHSDSALLRRPPWKPLGSFMLRSRRNEDTQSSLEFVNENAQEESLNVYVPPANFAASLRKGARSVDVLNKSPTRPRRQYSADSKKKSRTLWLPSSPCRRAFQIARPLQHQKEHFKK